MKLCCYCEDEFDDDDCRPYGVNGADTCYPCAMLPENKDIAEKQMHVLFDEAIRLGGGAVLIGHHTGPIPMPIGSDEGSN
jgi:hypothetical protein